MFEWKYYWLMVGITGAWWVALTAYLSRAMVDKELGIFLMLVVGMVAVIFWPLAYMIVILVILWRGLVWYSKKGGK